MKRRKRPPGHSILPKVSMLIKNVPLTLRARFKAHCARMNVTMTKRIRDLMTADCDRAKEPEA